MRSLSSQLRVLLNLVLAGTFLRLIGLGIHSLWLDEGACWSWAVRESWWGDDGTIFAEANHPPAWWIITRGWIEIFGSDSETALRGPAAVCGILTIPLAWMLGRRLFDPLQRPSRGGFDHTPDQGQGARSALWFAGLITLSTYFVEFSQEARMYALLIAEGLGLSLLYLRWLDKGDRLSLISYALLAALALHTQYFGIWIIVGHASHALWLWHRGRKTETPFSPWPFALACVGAGLLFIPWFVFMARNYVGIWTGDTYEPFSRIVYVFWRIGIGPALVVVDRARLGEGIGAVIAEEAPLVIGASLLWFTPLVLGFLRLRRHPGVGSFVFCNLATPLICLLLIFPAFQLIHERYITFLAPWLFLAATLGAREAKPWLRPLLLGGLLVLLGAGVFAYHGTSNRLVAVGPAQSLGDVDVPSRYAPDPEDPARVLNHGHPYGKEPWRQAHEFISAHAKDRDLVALHPPYLHLIWDYYDRGKHELALMPRNFADDAELEAEIGHQLEGRTRVFLILSHEEMDDPDYGFTHLHRLIVKTWVNDGGGRVDAPVRPILFELAGGVRVAVFNRR